MSAVCGVVHLDGRPASEQDLRGMMDAAPYRGPDGAASWLGGPAALGSLALHVTPESVSERQPLVGRESGCVLVADARLDNREELIALLGLAVPGAVVTDADVILAAYERWSDQCPARMLGDFAFAVWDPTCRQLFAARDPMAMRGLYYRLEPDRVLFGTEVKQILAAPDVPARIFEPAVAAWLASDYGPVEWTFYDGILQLPPGHALTVQAGRHSLRRYWDVDGSRRIEYRDEGQYVEHFLEIFGRAVGCRLRSRRPLGVFLSGGLDSGSVTSMAGWLRARHPQNGHSPLHAFCYAFERQPQCDERAISDQIARHYGIPTTSVPVDSAWPLKGYPDAVGPERDSPSVGPYQPMTELGLGLARQAGMAGMLGGDWGDHMMGGPIYDYPDRLLSGRWPSLWLDLLRHRAYDSKSVAGLLWHRVLAPVRTAAWPSRRAPWLREPLRRLLRRPRPHADWVRPGIAAQFTTSSSLGSGRTVVRGIAANRRYNGIFSSAELNTAVDNERDYARFGLNRLVPWGDRRVVEFALGVPPGLLCQAGEQKRFARRAMRGIMPEAARLQARKTYPLALYGWATRERERGAVLDLLHGSQAEARGYVDSARLQRHFESVGPDQEAVGFWPALALEMWLRRHWA